MLRLVAFAHWAHLWRRCLTVVVAGVPLFVIAPKVYAQCPCPDVCWDYTCNEGENCFVTGPTDWCSYPSGCPGSQSAHGTCCWQVTSPIVIDLAGHGFHLTNAPAGVPFAIEAADFVYQVAWTRPGRSGNAWLVLDRNRNGRIDNGQELFGNFADQPPPGVGEERNGFRALAEFDKPALGGNANGWFDESDAMFAEVRLWQDANHNGDSEAGELIALSAVGIRAVSLNFRRSRRVDQFGNKFAYRSAIITTHDSKVAPWAHDVYLRVTRMSQ